MKFVLETKRSKNFGKFPVTYPCGVLFKYAYLPGKFPESCLGQLFERRAYSACFCRMEPQSNLYRWSFPELYRRKSLKSAVCRPAVF